MYNLTDEQIHKILQTYKNKKQRESEYYHKSQKFNEDFVKKNRARAKKHYDNNKEKKKEKYETNSDILKAKSLLRYYKKLEKVDVFEEKHGEKVKLLKEKGFYI